MQEPDVPTITQQWAAVQKFIPFSLLVAMISAYRARYAKLWVILARACFTAATTPIACLAAFHFFPDKFYVAMAIGGFCGALVLDMVNMAREAIAKKLGVDPPKRRKEDSKP